jgi:hypothetical protein
MSGWEVPRYRQLSGESSRWIKKVVCEEVQISLSAGLAKSMNMVPFHKRLHPGATQEFLTNHILSRTTAFPNNPSLLTKQSALLDVCKGERGVASSFNTRQDLPHSGREYRHLVEKA